MEWPDCSSLTKLTRLCLTGFTFMSIESFATMPGLTELYFSHDWDADISPLSSLTNLKTLSVCSTTGDIIPVIASINSIEDITVSFPADYIVSVDLSVLATADKLRSIAIFNANITGLPSLAALESLEHIGFFDYSQVDPEEKEEFTQLRPNFDLLIQLIE